MQELRACNAEWLSNGPPSTEEIKKLSKIISLKNASPHFCLDDSNLTKSSAMSNIIQRLTKEINFDFKNLTKNVLDQKESNLDVPIAITVLIRWDIKNDLRYNDDLDLQRYFILEQIFTMLTMIIYPRSLAGLNLNPKNDEQEFQANNIEVLLKRLKLEKYLNKSGWDIIKDQVNQGLQGNFDFEKVLLHSEFEFIQPLTVTGAYQRIDGSIIFHQMVLDRIEDSQFILQNNLIDHSGSQIRIPLKREFYVTYEMMDACKKFFGDFVYYVDREKDEKLSLVNEKFNYMKEEQCSLLPQAYSITLTPPASQMDF